MQHDRHLVILSTDGLRRKSLSKDYIREDKALADHNFYFETLV
jgi:hypothetical protein